MTLHPSLFAALVAAFFCVSCAETPVNNQIVATTIAIRSLGAQVDRAERANWISNETEDRLINQLIQANAMLRYVNQPFPGSESCPQAIDAWSCIDQILLDVERQLQESEQ